MTLDEAARLEELIASISEIRGQLRPNERQFFDDIESRYAEQGADMFMSSRQWSWLSAIGDKA